MAYRAFLKPQGSPRQTQVSTMAQKGLNQEGLPEMMKLEFAKEIKNYIPYSYGMGLRKGLELIGEKAALTSGMTLCKYFTNNYFIVGYGTTIAAYDIVNDTFTDIKTDFSPSTRWGGGRYGEYFFVTNGVDKPYRIDNTLAETIVAAAPICDDISFIGPRAVAISLSSDETAIQLSEVDDGSNPPFDSWPTGTLATDGAVVNARNAGKARCCVALGQYFVVFSDSGYFAFYLNTIDSSGTLKKIEVVQDYITDFGGARGAITTPKGVFYMNESGLYQLLQVGQTDQPYSRQQKLTTVLLSDSYFADVDQANVDIIYDQNQRIVLVTYSQDSDTNNKVLGYKISDEVEALFEIEGWSLNRFTEYNGDIYATSAVDGKIYKCFSGWNDDGLEIGASYVQELPLAGLMNKHKLGDFYSKGFLSIDTEININFDIYDVDGAPQSAKRVHQWTAQRNDNRQDGWGTATYGQSAWGGDFDLSSMVESFDGCSPKIRNAQRISVKFTSSNLEPHIINWFSADVETKAPIRRRKQIKIS